MESLPVTLIVKAPNQQIEDQTIKCELSWTINKLKQHLSEVYPSKPPKHEQKLIYSGQLLPDTVVLKDVLRQYEGQEAHTVHLVCSTKQSTPKHQSASQPASMPVSDNPITSADPTPSNSSTEQRIPQWGNAGVYDANQYAFQMALMQQAYMQYMTQYINLMNGTNEAVVEATQEDVQQAAEPAPAPVQPPREVDAPQDRDWLDVFYMLTRIVVLSSVVYFYSSPFRFVCVLFFAFCFYLYQIGFFRNINNNNNNNNNNVQNEQGEQEIQSPSVLTIVWTFFTTFFTSLIPEFPNV